MVSSLHIHLQPVKAHSLPRNSGFSRTDVSSSQYKDQKSTVNHRVFGLCFVFGKGSYAQPPVSDILLRRFACALNSTVSCAVVRLRRMTFLSGVLPELAAAGLLQLRDLIAELLDLVSRA